MRFILELILIAGALGLGYRIGLAPGPTFMDKAKALFNI